jgi:hypothetical protein
VRLTIDVRLQRQIIQVRDCRKQQTGNLRHCVIQAAPRGRRIAIQ